MSALPAAHPTYTMPLQTPEEITREYEAKLAASARAYYTNEQLISAWVDHTKPGLEESSLSAWSSRTTRILQWLNARGLHILSVTRKEALDFIKWLEEGNYEGRKVETLAAGTVHKLAQHLSLILDYLKDVRGLVRVNACEGVVKLYTKQHKSELRPDLRAVTEEEARLWLKGAETLDEFTLLLLLLKTGVRREEAARIRTDQIDWKTRTISVTPHPKRTFNRVYFDEELEHFLRLKVQKNAREYPGNPYLFPSPVEPMSHLKADTVGRIARKLAEDGPLGRKIDWKDRKQKATTHTTRRAFTSWLKRARRKAPQGCPSHVVATLRGDSLRARSELIPDPTQGIYTKFGEVDGVDELRYWYDNCMPELGAIALWEEMTPSAWNAQSVEALIRSQRAA